MALTDQARDLTIRTILGEAGGESPQGWQAVAHVIKNRADSGRWGDPSNGGLTNTIMAPKQFSLWNPGNAAGDLARRAQPSDPAYQRIGAIVDGVFNGTTPDITGGATHYYAPQGMQGGQPPDWAAGGSNKMQIGNHVFMTLPLTGANTAGTAVQPGAAPPPHAAVQPQDPLAPPVKSGNPSDITDVTKLAGFRAIENKQDLMNFMGAHNITIDPQNVAWCAALVQAHLANVGIQGPRTATIPGEGGVGTQAAPGSYGGYDLRASAFTNWGQQIQPNAIQAGDVLVRNDSSPGHGAAGPTGHVGLATGNTRQGANGVEYEMISGNTGGVHGDRTVGYGWVPSSMYDARRGAPASVAPDGTTQPAPATQPAGTTPAQPTQPAQQPQQQVAQQANPFAGLAQSFAEMSARSPPPPPPMQPQYSMAAQAPIETPGIQSPANPAALGDTQTGGADQQVPGPLAPAGGRGFDPFRYRRQQAPTGAV